MADPLNPMVVRKRMPICEAIGDYINGSFEGELSPDRFAEIVKNFKKHPRQVPVYLLVGDPNPEHPDDLDSKVPAGWIEGVSTDGRYLYADPIKLIGDGASYVTGDLVRGASIGTIQGTDYDGTPIGEVLEHVVLTNNPFVKGMNIAASRAKGGEKVACYFTALTEASMAADPKKKADPAVVADPPDDVTPPAKEVETLTMLVQEKDKAIRELSDKNDLLTEELQERQKNGDLELALKENRQLKLRLDAAKIRELVALGASPERGQFRREDVVGFEGGDDRSDALTLSWFKNSIFDGDMEKLKFALKRFKKNPLPRRSFVSGDPGDGEASEYTAEEKKAIVEAGKDPVLLAQTRKARNLTEYKAAKKAAGKE